MEITKQQFYSSSEVAKYLGMTPSGILAMIHRGDIKADITFVGLKRTVYKIPESELKRLLKILEERK